MGGFQKVAKKARAPGRTLEIEPWAFADDWDGKPKATICVGLKLVSETDKTVARTEAEKLADELHPRRGPLWVEAYNDALMRQVVAVGICDPNDIEKPCDTLKLAQDMVGHALTSRGTAYIFNAVDRYEIETSPIGVPASKSEVERLCELLGKTDVEALPVATRRMLSHVLEQLELLQPD